MEQESAGQFIWGWRAIAEFLGVSRATAKRLKADGLPVQRLCMKGRRPRIFASPKELLEWFN